MASVDDDPASDEPVAPAPPEETELRVPDRPTPTRREFAHEIESDRSAEMIEEERPLRHPDRPSPTRGEE